MRQYSIDVESDQLKRLRRLGSKHSLAYLPSHRSYLDPFVLRTVLHQHGLPPNHVLGGVNVAFYVSHGSIRREVLGMADRAPTAAELDRMVALARTGMETGAIGLSSGLYYAPGSYAKIEEVIARA